MFIRIHANRRNTLDVTKNAQRCSLTKIITSIIGVIAIMLATLVLLPSQVLAVPQPPHVFHGAFSVGGAPAPDGLTITATIAGASFPYVPTAQTSGGRYGDDLQFRVPADEPETPAKEGGVNGDTVVFYLNGTVAGTYTFQIGGVTELNLSINNPPIASFIYSPESPGRGQEITFDASSSRDPDGQIVSYEWDLGDGSTATGQIVRHSYSMQGDYTVILIVEDRAGATDAEVKTVYVALPRALTVRGVSMPDPGTFGMVGSGLAAALFWAVLSRLRLRLNRRS